LLYIYTLFKEEGGFSLENKMVEYRKNLELSQEKLAEKLGVSRQTIISIEKGKYDPSLPLAFEIAKAFQTTIENVFIYEGKERE
jgi:putative transcriptional regulator